MDAGSLQHVKQVFHQALERSDGDREAFLNDACRSDSSLREQVEVLLAAHEDAGPFLAHPTQADLAGSAGDDDEVRDRLQRALAGRYSLEGELGRGGMGIVFLARDVALDRRVAIKLLPPRLATDPEYRERFLREARTAAGLSHPHIVPIHLVEEQDDLVYFVMAFVDGETLGDRVRRAGPLKAADAARLVQEVAWALAYAHTRGVIHRDVKPDNIMIDSGSGRALVTDFGIARVATTETLSAQGDVLGTLQYMSPEQATGEDTIDGRADLYSLGVTAFFALTGRLPFEAANSVAVMAMHITEPPPPLKSVTSTVPARLAAVVDRCLAKDPEARFPTGEALAEAIGAAEVTRKGIAPSVREFLSGTKSGLFQVWALGSIWAMLAEVTPRVMPAGRLLGNPLDPIFFILTGLSTIVVARWITIARGVVRAGLDEQDVAEAIGSSSTVHDANVEYEIARVTRLANRLATLPGRAVSTLIGLLPLAWVPEGIAIVVTGGVDPFPRLATAGLMVILTATATLFFGMAIAPRRVLAVFTRGTPEFGKVWQRLWAGPFGRWLFKLVGIGIKKGKTLPAADPARTEVILGRAAGELFAQLPKEQRDRLRDMPDVIGHLEDVAATLRTRRDELTAALAEVGEPDAATRRGALVTELQEAQQAVNDRLAAAVGALETLRLDLLRLKAGVGRPDDLTAVIEEARAVGEAIDLELAAKREVEAAISPPTFAAE